MEREKEKEKRRDTCYICSLQSRDIWPLKPYLHTGLCQIKALLGLDNILFIMFVLVKYGESVASITNSQLLKLLLLSSITSRVFFKVHKSRIFDRLRALISSAHATCRIKRIRKPSSNNIIDLHTLIYHGKRKFAFPLRCCLDPRNFRVCDEVNVKSTNCKYRIRDNGLKTL
jgi:hypothetical protein